ncbi:signal peptidase I [Alkalihalobacillus clausii]|uniref:signal peptidase I n=1 Tax=Shouchella clausii TaxID=79880 RepID=UPI00203DA8CC|nr:signal peptidase I [Shouchella clausii]MCM3550089.1 signal peptidase I [Shouchella clausii]
MEDGRRGAEVADAKRNSEFWGWVKTIAIAFILAVGIRTFVIERFEVQGASMVPTAHDGEQFIIDKWSYQFGEPERFDLIKRVIGLPGDTIRFENDILYINGEQIEEPYLQEAKAAYSGPVYTEDYSFEEAVPENHVFVMGDNRPTSLDSRTIGPVSEDKIIGKVGLRFWPLPEFDVQ